VERKIRRQQEAAAREAQELAEQIEAIRRRKLQAQEERRRVAVS